MKYEWALTPHICRICSGRVLQRIDETGARLVMCAECGTTGQGDHRAICCCGAKLRDGRNAGLRCVANPNKTPERPVDIVVEFVGEEKIANRNRPRPLRKDDNGGLFDETET